jgi:hypothetical protein
MTIGPAAFRFSMHDCLFILVTLTKLAFSPLTLGIFSKCYDDHPNEVLCEKKLGG